MLKCGRPNTAATLPEEVLCGVCLSIFIDPCTLTCGHTWCQRCLREICSPPAARCPSCRARILSPPSVNIQFRKLLQRCFGEAERARRERLPPSDTPLCNGGFEGVAIERLLDVDKLLGLPGGPTATYWPHGPPVPLHGQCPTICPRSCNDTGCPWAADRPRGHRSHTHVHP